MSDQDFQRRMLDHMERQTAFLASISEGMQAVRMFGRIIKWAGGVASTVAGVFGLWTFLSKH